MIKSVGGLIAELESKVDEINIEESTILGDIRALEILIPHAKLSQREQMLTMLKNALEKLLTKTSLGMHTIAL